MPKEEKFENLSSSLEFPENEIREIPLAQIEPDTNQIRKEFKNEEMAALFSSIKENGLHQPIQVTAGRSGKFKIIAGERRYRAHKELGLDCIKAIYIAVDNKERGIIDNILHETYNPMETAQAYQQLKCLIGNKATDSDVAAKVGKSRSLITNYLSLLKLPKEVQKMARENSCVPFRKLKQLASTELSVDEKIEAYNQLYAVFSKNTQKPLDKEKKSKKEKNKKGNNAEETQTSNRETRTILAATKKVTALNSYLNKVVSFSKADQKALNDFHNELLEIIAFAQKLLPKQSAD